MKHILCICIAVLLTGCATALAKDDYKTMDISALEQQADEGNLAASFWLGDRYFLDSDISRAFSKWRPILLAIEENPKITSESWFREAYGDYHPVAILLQLFSLASELQTVQNDFEAQKRLIEEIGADTDDFFVAQGRYPKYEPFFEGSEEVMASLGDILYMLGEYFADMGKREEAFVWAERSCKLKSAQGCSLAFQTL